MITIKSDFSCYRLFAKKMFTSSNAGRSVLKNLLSMLAIKLKNMMKLRLMVP
jgi:hypothetical protein